MTPRILVIDDEEPILFASGEYFKALGFEVDCARELEEAEALLSHIPYAAVIADLRLTGSHGAEGFDILGCVGEHCPWTPVILLTAYGSPDVEEEARRRGATSFLHKPRPLPDVAQIVFAVAGAPSRPAPAGERSDS